MPNRPARRSISLSPHSRGERVGANCHQIGDPRYREPRTDQEWEAIVNRRIAYGGVPFFAETRPVLLPTLLSVFGESAPAPHFDVPPPPRGDAVRVVIYEWEIDPAAKPSCHDLELGLDGTVYTAGGVWTFNPITGERGHYPVRPDGGHSIERDANGDMWITAAGADQLMKFDVRTKEFTKYHHPRIGDDLRSYPHALRFDHQGRICYTLSRSNHVARFDPPTAQFTYHRLPPAGRARRRGATDLRPDLCATRSGRRQRLPGCAVSAEPASRLPHGFGGGALLQRPTKGRRRRDSQQRGAFRLLDMHGGKWPGKTRRHRPGGGRPEGRGFGECEYLG